MTTLLETAKAAKLRKELPYGTAEHADLLMAYAKEEVSARQICSALKLDDSSSSFSLFGSIAVACIRAGLLVRKTDGAK